MNLVSSSQQPAIVGVDIGGANLKLATLNGRAWSRPFRMWREADRLGEALSQALRELGVSPQSTRLAVTITGELADCFQTRREGTVRILDHVCSVVHEEDVAVYSVNGHWRTVGAAKTDPWDVAAANWRALADWVVACADAQLPVVDLLIDIGSTTTDIIPLFGRRVATVARTDRERLQAHQLVYMGGERTPLMAIAPAVVVGAHRCPVMAEWFADAGDVHLVLGLAAEAPNDHETADGRPRTRQCAAARLCRMVGEDVETLSWSEIENIAQQFLDHQVETICRAVEQQFQNCSGGATAGPWRVLCSGHARGLAQCVVHRLRDRGMAVECFWLDEILGTPVARCAPAYACAQLLAMQRSDAEKHQDASVQRNAPHDESRRVAITSGRSTTKQITKEPGKTDGPRLPLRVLKVGGSLLDLPQLGRALQLWLNGEPKACNLIVVGGGKIVDAVRHLDRVHQFDTADVHWLCVELLDATCRIMHWLLPEVPTIASMAELDAVVRQCTADRATSFLIRPRAFYNAAHRPTVLPVGWEVTTDSIAAYLAELVGADELVLLKSVDPPAGQAKAAAHTATVDQTLASWSHEGIVDRAFGQVARCIPVVRCVNFRAFYRQQDVTCGG